MGFMSKMKREERAQSYVKRLRTAQDPQAEVEAVAADIRSLVWSSTQEPLTQDEQLAIIDMMLRQTEGRVYIQKEADNKRYLALVRDLRRLLG